MREYGMDYFKTLAIPLITFWSLNRQVDRLRAEEEQRHLRVVAAGSSDSPEMSKNLNERLTAEIGEPVGMEREFDEDQFAKLDEKFSAIRVQSDTHTE